MGPIEDEQEQTNGETVVFPITEEEADFFFRNRNEFYTTQNTLWSIIREMNSDLSKLEREYAQACYVLNERLGLKSNAKYKIDFGGKFIEGKAENLQVSPIS